MTPPIPKQVELIARERRWPVIPLNNQKKPSISAWKVYQSAAPTMEQIER